MELIYDDARLKDFLLLTGKAGVSAACDKYDISKASYYRLINEVVKRTTTFCPTARSAVEKKSTRALAIVVTKIAENHPTWGCSSIAKEISRTTPISAPTIQKALNRLSIGSRQARIVHLMNRVISGQIASLSSEQEIAISEINQSVIDTPLLRNKNLLVFGGSFIALPCLGDGNWGVLLFVELGSLFAIGLLVKKSRSAQYAADVEDSCIVAMANIKQASSRQDYKIFWYGKNKRVPFFCDREKKPRINVEAVSKRPGGVVRVGSQIEVELSQSKALPFDELEKRLSVWLRAYNLSPSDNCYPTFRVAPCSAIRLIGVH